MTIKSTSREPVIYVPAYDGNRDDEKPLSVVITPLSRQEADKYTKSTSFTQKKGYRGEWESNAVVVQKRQFISNVKEVHNFIDNESGEEITDIGRFYNEAPHDLIEEILTCILDESQIEEKERKNL